MVVAAFTCTGGGGGGSGEGDGEGDAEEEEGRVRRKRQDAIARMEKQVYATSLLLTRVRKGGREGGREVVHSIFSTRQGKDLQPPASCGGCITAWSVWHRTYSSGPMMPMGGMYGNNLGNQPVCCI
jgi:hypothetical protein